ncbi:unnamed protein product [Linum trigynum]|uniref:Uncharacterized protein n=1 Tax=Linum trigynum TaxID=586398 RepID=A0AAV2FE71_9ROSI
MAAIATSVSPSFCYRKSSRIDSCFLSTDTLFSPPWTSNASTPPSRSWTTRSKLTCSEPRSSATATDCSRSAIRTRKWHSGRERMLPKAEVELPPGDSNCEFVVRIAHPENYTEQEPSPAIERNRQVSVPLLSRAYVDRSRGTCDQQKKKTHNC